MEQPTTSAVRVLIRPPPSSSSSSSAARTPPVSASSTQTDLPPRNPSPLPPAASDPTTSSSSAAAAAAVALPPPIPPPEGVVVVGFVGSGDEDDVTHLINRVLDANVFGSGGLDKDLCAAGSEVGQRKEEWFQHRRISYYYDKEKGTVFLQFSSSVTMPRWVSGGCSSAEGGDDTLESFMEERDSDDLRGLLLMFSVTPPFPFVLTTCPVIQFEDSCLPPSVLDREQQSQFSPGCPIILPPESFITFRLPFIYGVQLNDGSLEPLHHLEHQPELTAWLAKGTSLQIMSNEFNSIDDFSME